MKLLPVGKAILTLLFCCWVVVLPAQKKRSITTKDQLKIAVLDDRSYWIKELDRIARPVLLNLAKDSLRINMPQTVSVRIDNASHRIAVSYLEVVARTFAGIAPWLQGEGGSEYEVQLRNQYREWAITGLANAVNPDAKDFVRFNLGGQQLVDASFLAHALIRAPWLWENSSDITKKRIVEGFLHTRKYRPVFSNWLLFSGMIEAFFCKYGYEWDVMRVDFAVRQIDEWYVGDGVYSDGTSYRWDYYNSFVIHPYLADIITVINAKGGAYNWMNDRVKKRSERYAVLQERLINADGSFPATGRSIVYRGAAFHHLADVAWKKKLPTQLKPAQVRGALTAVIKKTLEAPTTFTADGWLTIGLYGAQPNMADFYNNTGSLYICTSIFLPLGLSPDDPFWKDDPAEWSAQQIWSGKNFPNDYGIE